MRCHVDSMMEIAAAAAMPKIPSSLVAMLKFDSRHKIFFSKMNPCSTLEAVRLPARYK